MFQKVISDLDFGFESAELSNPKTRLGARGIVVKDGKWIAIFYKQAKNQFKLPGGGIDGNENPVEAFKREVLEETGCKVCNVEQIGEIEEHQSQGNFKQKSFVFASDVLLDTKKQELTEREKDEESVLLWLEPQEALEKMQNCMNSLKDSKYENIYQGRFIVKRDIEILKYYIENK